MNQNQPALKDALFLMSVENLNSLRHLEKERATDAKHQQQFPILNHRYLGLHTVWIGFYGLVLMLGIGLTGLILEHGRGITL